MRAKGILVLGMHRSGTSATTRLLNLLGADVPGNLLPAQSDNEKGFWESRDLRDLHDALLATCGSAYDDVLALPASALARRDAVKIRDEIVSVMRRDFGRSGLFVVKDPRVSRFVPFWRGILAELDADPLIVVCIRHPLEVAASLRKRNDFSTAKSLLLWLRHTIDSERTTRDLPRAIVRYDDLLADWRGVANRVGAELGLALSITDYAVSEIDRFLSPQMRHHAIDPSALAGDSRVASWVRDAYAAFVEPGSPSGRIDAVAASYEEAEATWGAAIREERSAAARLHDDAHQEISRLAAKIVGLEELKAREVQGREHHEREAANAHALRAAVVAEVEALAGRVEELRGQTDAGAHELAAAQAKIEAQRKEIDEHRARADQGLATRTARELRTAAILARRALDRAAGRTPLDPARTALDRLAPEQIVDALYRCVLAREADDGGRRNHLAELGSGKPARDLALAFVASQELDARLRQALGGESPGAVSLDRFATAIYASLLGRDPNAEEIARTATRCAAENGRIEVMAELVTSDEFVAYVSEPLRPPTVEHAVWLGDGRTFLVGKLSEYDNDPLVATLRSLRSEDVVTAVEWWEKGDEPDTFRRRFMAMLPSLAATERRIELRWRARNGRFYSLRGPVPITDPTEGLRAILESFSPEGRTPQRLEYAHPAVARLRERDQAETSVKRVFTIGNPPARPVVSIVIPLYKRLDFVEHQLAQFADDETLENAEIIYVLDSPELDPFLEENLEPLFRLYRVPSRVIVQRRNSGYSAANNAGAYAASGRLLLLLNSDVFPTRPGWLPELVEFHDATPNVGALGPKLLYEDESLQHAGMYFAKDHGAAGLWYNAHYFKGFPRHFPRADVARAVPAVTGACLLVSRDLYCEVGGLREIYVQANFEDSDFCLRLARAGRQNWYLPSVELFHLEGQSFRLDRNDWRDGSYAYNRWLHTHDLGREMANVMSGYGEPSA